jgi:putative phage-type endonuclease
MEQRSKEWHEIRRGKFAASEIYKLIGTGKTPSKFGKELSDWTDTAQAYIMSKVAETFSDQDHEISSPAMCWGVEHESEARAYYEGIFNEEVEEVGFVLWARNTSAGCSPDGIISARNRGIEIKCPYTLNAHLESFLINTNEQFHARKPEYYWQVQSSMLFTGYDAWDFISYHPYFHKNKRITCIEILPDPVAFQVITERIMAAVEVRDKLIKEIEL